MLFFPLAWGIRGEWMILKPIFFETFLFVNFQLIMECIIEHKNKIKNCQESCKKNRASYHFILNNLLVDLGQRMKSNQTLFICLFSKLITKILQCVNFIQKHTVHTKINSFVLKQ